MKNKITKLISDLDINRHLLDTGVDYWKGRDIQRVLGYLDWRNFEGVIQKTRESCRGTNIDPDNHIVETTVMVQVGSGAKRSTPDYILSRYACYLIAMNGNTSKPEVAAAQQYFAVQTRRMELESDDDDLMHRMEMRAKVRAANKGLNSAAKESGVTGPHFGIFHGAGYRGLYGMSLKEVKEKKSIGVKEELLDRAGHAELASNYFRITQTQQKLSRENVSQECHAISTHQKVGKTVRRTIAEMGGTMPEDLPPEPSIKKLERLREMAEQLADEIPKRFCAAAT